MPRQRIKNEDKIHNNIYDADPEYDVALTKGYTVELDLADDGLPYAYYLAMDKPNAKGWLPVYDPVEKEYSTLSPAYIEVRKRQCEQTRWL